MPRIGDLRPWRAKQSQPIGLTQFRQVPRRTTPKAFANSSPGLLQPWDQVEPTIFNPERVPRGLIPNISLVIIDCVRLEKRTVFILERHPFVMLFLVFDIPNHVAEI